MSGTENSPAKALFISNPNQLARRIFQMELTEAELRSLPAQSIYLSILTNGLDSSIETLLCLSPEQFKLILDFDLWQEDTFLEENFWNLIELEESSTEPLTICQRILRHIDYKILGIIISEYVEVVTLEHQSDTPPGEGFYTPDLGFTWLKIISEDSRKVFLLNRFLALIFESSAEIFYQLMSIRNVCTKSILEEEAYQDQRRRLISEGIPDLEMAAELNQPITLADIKNLAEENREHSPLVDIDIIPALITSSELLQPWSDVITQAKNAENLAIELSYIINSAIVFYKVCPSELKQVTFIAQQVRGLINLGLESIISEGMNPVSTIEKIGLKPIYQSGLGQLQDLKKTAQKILHTAKIEELAAEQYLLLENLTKKLPTLPTAFDCVSLSWLSYDGKILPEIKAFETQIEVEAVATYLAKSAN